VTSHPVQICDSLTSHIEKSWITRSGGSTRPEDCFLSPFVPRKTEWPTQYQPKPFYSWAKTQPCFFPHGWTHPPSPVPPFCWWIEQNGYCRHEVSCCKYALL